MVGNSLNGGDVLSALLQHNFLPNQKKDNEELPPTITSLSFSDSVAEQLSNCKDNRSKDYPGYDTVEYKLTRFNGVSRVISIPHPKPYADLALCLSENWEKIEHIMHNDISKIRPEFHADGRIIVMNYEDRVVKTQQNLSLSFGKRFVVHTDISNFYPSVYSHSIPWALVGFDVSKKNRSADEWYNKLDKAIRMSKRNETNGVVIGPATSNIIAEIILAKIDKKLSEKFKYTRFVDDYTAYCRTHKEAQRFVSRLAEELAKYKLTLNIGKTNILELPQPSNSDWIVDLNNTFHNSRKLSVYDAVSFLDFALHLSKQSPDGSVLKYALKSLIASITPPEIDYDTVRIVLKYAITLSFYQPTLVPLLEPLFEIVQGQEGVGGVNFSYQDDLQKLMQEHTRLRFSDAVCWELYFANKYNVPVTERCANSILESQECLPLLFLYQSVDQKDKVIKFASDLVKDKNDLYKMDQYWLLLYQLFLDGNVSNPAGSHATFRILRDSAVTFWGD